MGEEKRECVSSTEALTVGLFGPVVAYAKDGSMIAIPSRRARTLLGMLCLARGERLSRSLLARLLWPARLKPQAKASLRQALYTLTTALSDAGHDVIDADFEAVSLREGCVSTYIDAIMQTLADGDDERAVAAFAATGDRVLIEDADAQDDLAQWLARRRARVNDTIRRAVDMRCAALVEAGDQRTRDALLHACSARWRPASGAAAPTPRSVAAVDFSVCILPFEVGNDVEQWQDHAATLRCELIDKLARSEWLRVAPATEVEHGGKLHHARYAVDGFISASAKGMRFRLALSSRKTGAQLWSRRIDFTAPSAEEAFEALIEECALSVATEIHLVEAAGIGDREGPDVDSFAAIGKIEMLRKLYSVERALEIESHFEAILGSDPNDALAHAALAVQLAQGMASGFYADRYPLDEVRHHMARANALAPDHPQVMASAGIVATMLGDTPEAVRLLERALKADPNNPHTLAVLAFQRCYLEAGAEPIELIRRAERLAPHHPRHSIWAYYRGFCWFKLDDPARACDAFRESIERNPNFHYPHIFWASALARMGRDAEATSHIVEALCLLPHYRPEHYCAVPNEFAYAFPPGMCAEDYRADLRRLWPVDDAVS